MSDLWLETLCNGISALQGGPMVHLYATADEISALEGDVGGTGGDEPAKEEPDIRPVEPPGVPAPQAPQPEIVPGQPSPPMDPGIPAPEA